MTDQTSGKRFRVKRGEQPPPDPVAEPDRCPFEWEPDRETAEPCKPASIIASCGCHKDGLPRARRRWRRTGDA